MLCMPACGGSSLLFCAFYSRHTVLFCSVLKATTTLVFECNFPKLKTQQETKHLPIILSRQNITSQSFMDSWETKQSQICKRSTVCLLRQSYLGRLKRQLTKKRLHQSTYVNFAGFFLLKLVKKEHLCVCVCVCVCVCAWRFRTNLVCGTFKQIVTAQRQKRQLTDTQHHNIQQKLFPIFKVCTVFGDDSVPIWWWTSKTTLYTTSLFVFYVWIFRFKCTPFREKEMLSDVAWVTFPPMHPGSVVWHCVDQTFLEWHLSCHHRNRQKLRSNLNERQTDVGGVGLYCHEYLDSQVRPMVLAVDRRTNTSFFQRSNNQQVRKELWFSICLGYAIRLQRKTPSFTFFCHLLVFGSNQMFRRGTCMCGCFEHTDVTSFGFLAWLPSEMRGDSHKAMAESRSTTWVIFHPPLPPGTGSSNSFYSTNLHVFLNWVFFFLSFLFQFFLHETIWSKNLCQGEALLSPATECLRSPAVPCWSKDRLGCQSASWLLALIWSQIGTCLAGPD